MGSLFIAEFIMDGLVGYRSNIYEARGSYISFLSFFILLSLLSRVLKSQDSPSHKES